MSVYSFNVSRNEFITRSYFHGLKRLLSLSMFCSHLFCSTENRLILMAEEAQVQGVFNSSVLRCICVWDELAPQPGKTRPALGS